MIQGSVWLASVSLLAFGYWRTKPRRQLFAPASRLQRRAFLLALCSCLLFAAGPILAAGTRSFEWNWTVYLLCFIVPWFLSLVCAVAGLASGARTEGWSRIATVGASGIMLALLMWILGYVVHLNF